MDVIYTDSKRVDIGVLSAYSLDLSFGADDNDFEIILGADEPTLEFGAFIYVEGTEYGGIIDALWTSSDDETITYIGRTWHGVLNSKIIEPDEGEDYLTVSGTSKEILDMLITRLGLSQLFTVDLEIPSVNISSYKFNRYCAAYEGIVSMLSSVDAKLKIEWKDRMVYLSAVPITDYTNAPIDGDVATLTVEQHSNTVNHLICLGSGELAEREVIHLYVDRFGKIGTTQYYTGLNERTEIYDYSAVQSSDELLSGGIKRLKELRDKNKADISINETVDLMYDIGDIVGATEIRSGISVSATVTQKIVKINSGTIKTEYQTGG